MVPWIVTPQPSVRVESSSALVRSSAVRPGARKEHAEPIETLLSSLMDRSIPPATRQEPSRVSSAPTDSRGALRAVPPLLAREYALPTGRSPVASSVALRMRNCPPIRARPMSIRPRMSGRLPEVSSIRKMLPSTTASPRSRARPVSGDSRLAPVRSSEPPIRAPIRRTSPRAVNLCNSRVFPPTCIRSA